MNISQSKCKNSPTSLHMLENFENTIEIIMDYINILETGSKIMMMQGTASRIKDSSTRQEMLIMCTDRYNPTVY